MGFIATLQTKRGDFQRASEAMNVISKMAPSTIPNQSFLGYYQVDMLEMQRGVHRYQVIKELLESQKNDMLSQEWYNNNEYLDRYDWDRNCSECYFRQSLNKWSHYFTNAKESGSRNLTKAIKHCRKAMQHGRRIYPEKSYEMFRYVFTHSVMNRCADERSRQRTCASR